MIKMALEINKEKWKLKLNYDIYISKGLPLREQLCNVYIA